MPEGAVDEYGDAPSDPREIWPTLDRLRMASPAPDSSGPKRLTERSFGSGVLRFDARHKGAALLRGEAIRHVGIVRACSVRFELEPRYPRCMTSSDEARIAAAVEKASEAFWAAFAADFPEINTGDMDPLTTVRFDDAVEQAAREWLRLNLPERATA